MIYHTGSVLIIGKNSEEYINIGYNYIKKFFLEKTDPSLELNIIEKKKI